MSTTTASPVYPAALNTGADQRPTFLTLVKVELRKLVNTRAGRWLLIAIFGLTVLVAVIAAIAMDPANVSWSELMQPATIPLSVLMPVVAILTLTSEWSQRTGLSTFTLVPHRSRTTAAKLAATSLALIGLFVSALTIAAVVNLVAGVVNSSVSASWNMPLDILFGSGLGVAISTMLGCAFGMLLANTAVAIVSFFVLPTIWSVLGELVSFFKDAGEWLDLGVTTVPLSEGNMNGDSWAKLLVSVLAWVVLPLALGLYRQARREVK